MSDPPARSTQRVRGKSRFVRRFEVRVVAGTDVGTRVASDSESLSIGTAEGNELRLTDPAVSRHHCTLSTHERGLELRDHGSRNGTYVGECELARGFVVSGARIRAGETTLEVRVLDDELEQPIATGDRLGSLVGASPEMRRLYALVDECASSTATVLIDGETGTGKELIAEAIHERGPRGGQRFVVVDCSALSHDLAESELFGHERGAFTGADAARAGAFEVADRGTIFLDEIGELPLALQPLLLRALEAREVRRVGATGFRAIDVRVIAASHRDLRELVNNKRFRPDLFYRLNVIRISAPPLRARPSDVRLLATHFWQLFRPDRAIPGTLLDRLVVQSWPGNVRELRNAVERAALVGWDQTPAPEPQLTYQQAKERATWEWERGWVERLLAVHGGNLSRASRAARMGRSHLRELVRRHLPFARDALDE